MGELLDIPEWMAVTLFVILGLSIWLGAGYWLIRRAHQRVAARRPNPTRQEFLAMMREDCSVEVAEFLWAQTLSYVEPRLTPHADDLLFADLKIDDDDVSLDWTREWAERQGFDESDYPDWPEEWPVTVRNFGRWLDMAPV